MINPSKTVLMAKIAVEDKKNIQRGRKAIGISWFEFIVLNSLFSFLAYSIAFILGVGGYLVARFDYVMDTFVSWSIKEIGWSVLIIYAVGLIVYMVISVVYYTKQYQKYRLFMRRNNRRIQVLKHKFYQEGANQG